MDAAITGTASLPLATVTDLLAMYIHTGQLNDPSVFFDICLSLARGIDHAVANNEVPSRSRDLPILLKQVFRCNYDFSLQAAFMVLMMSIKSACRIGWFPNKETDDLLTLAKEVGKYFSNTENICIESSSALPYLSKITSRFYPKMKLKHILVSLEVKPGYGAFVADFHISRSMMEHEDMWLFVARKDNMETSSCITTPPEVNFLLNGQGIRGRTNVAMDNGPQLPTNVTAILKYGINLLQAVGQFNGQYIIVVAILSMISISDTPELQDYVQPVVASVVSDSETIEMSAQISVNCPISQHRMKTPVKGHLCKHPQCFDYDNFLEINSRRPSWRCPHCNLPICYPDVRIDQNVVKVLREVGENVVDVIISVDGSWKAVLENKDHSAQTCGKTQISQQEGHQRCESSSSIVFENGNSFQDNQSYCAAGNLMPPEANKAYQNTSSALSGSAFFITSLSADKVNRSSDTPPSSIMHSPVLADAVSLACPQNFVDDHGRTQVTTSLLQNHMFNPYNLQLQQSSYRSTLADTEFGRLPSIDGQVNRNPSAHQPLPPQIQIPCFCQNPRILNPLVPSGASSAMSQTIPSMASNRGGCDLLNEGTERWQQSSWSHINASSVSAMASSSVQQHLVTQNWVDNACCSISGQFVPQDIVLPAQNSCTYNSSSWPPSVQQNGQHQNPLNLNSTQALNKSQNMVHAIVRVQPVPGQRDGGGLATGAVQQAPQMSGTPPSMPVQNAASRTSSAFSIDMVAERFRTAGEERPNMHGAMQPISRGDGLAAEASENWRPSGRMRGSLQGQAYSAAYHQFIIEPTQPARASQPSSTWMPTLPGTSQVRGLITNSTNSQNFSQARHRPSIGNAINLPGSSGTLPERSQ